MGFYHFPTKMNVKQICLVIVGLMATLGCSVGTLLVQVPTPTPTPHKTPKPTFTFTPIPTPTIPPTFTPTLSPTPTFTPTPTPTVTPTEAAQPQSAPPPAQPQPAPPTPTPPPPEPTATPKPSYPFNMVYYTHNTGSPGETRITAWIRRDIAPGKFKTLANYQVKVLAPDGQEYLSEPSGTGFADSTMSGTGDNHRMNTKVEIRPYTPGPYKITLVEGGIQVSPEIELNLSPDPMQYVHIDFFKPPEE